MNRYLFLTALFLLSYATISRAEKGYFLSGYIVNNDLDTIYGEIDFKTARTNAYACNFRKSPTDEIRTYSPNELFGFGITDGQKYYSKYIKEFEDKFYLEYLVDGLVDLFYLNKKGAERYYLEKDGELFSITNDEREKMVDGTRYVEKSNAYLRELNYIMQDQKEVMDNNSRLKYSSKDLIKITKEYNNAICDTLSCQVYYKTKSQVKWTLRPGVVIASQFMDIETIEPIYPKSSYLFHDKGMTYSIGAFVEVGRNDQWLTSLGVEYQSVKLSTIEMQKILIPLVLSYKLMPYAKVKPILSFGFKGDYRMNEDLVAHAQMTPKFKFGARIGLGAEVEIFKNNELRIEVYKESNLNYGYGYHYTDMIARVKQTGLAAKYIF